MCNELSPKRYTNKLLAMALAGCVLIPVALGQSAKPPLSTETAVPKRAVSVQEYKPSRFPKRADLYYGLVWGVDDLSVRTAESGELVRFSWRVQDPAKAETLHNKKNEPKLFDPQAKVQLVIPTMEKVGQLRQASRPEAGRSYWMAFSNKGRPVKQGDRVTVVIGNFKAEGLVVQ
jgi:hypothetical protein